MQISQLNMLQMQEIQIKSMDTTLLMAERLLVL
nr:MAG TPA: hypothetical protein [Bacteriophage sp.]